MQLYLAKHLRSRPRSSRQRNCIAEFTNRRIWGLQARAKMALKLPDIPIATANPFCLQRLGRVSKIPGAKFRNAFAFAEDVDGFRSVWCRVEYRNYRRAWERAAIANLVDPLSDWGEHIDVDHLIARHIARARKLSGWFLRLHPVYREINRSAGAGRERCNAEQRLPWSKRSGTIFAGELQVLKGLSHPVGTNSFPETLFDK